MNRGPWMQTFSGVAFYPFSPSPDDVNVRDIAHALSMLCRYAGHSRRFYSVAEHSLLVAEFARPRLRLRALLHDAAEAYVCDLPRPLKSGLPDYASVVRVVEWAVRKRFGIVNAPADDTEIKALDDRILEDERRALMCEPPIPWSDRVPLGAVIQCMTPETAEAQFIYKFIEYGGRW